MMNVRPYRLKYPAEPFFHLRGEQSVASIELPIARELACGGHGRGPGDWFQDAYTFVDGYVVDAEDGQPLRGASIRLIHANLNTQTDHRGYYSFSVPTPPEAAGRPGTETLLAQLPGYKTMILRNFVLTGDDTGFTLDLQRGSGTGEHDMTHTLLRTDAAPSERRPGMSGHRISADLHEWLGTRGQPISAGAVATKIFSASITVPSTIRVGTNCGTPMTCTSLLIYTLEGYVQQGLGQEWISSWDPNALRAGAVAYRTRGAYFSNNPVTDDYDICDTTACQLFSPFTRPSKSIVSAVAATTGVVLSQDNVTIFAAEYSPESNLASDAVFATCPDGQVGEPSNGWPCMRDPLCAGTSAANTHSRGMCQWGSQRWATGRNAAGALVTAPRDWRCILDHYYNANSNSIMVDPTNTGVAGTGNRTVFLQNQATYGKVAYVNTLDNSIRALNAADGSGDALLAGASWSPAWSLGGDRLAYTFQASPGSSTTSLGVINSDGTGRTQITRGAGSYMDASGDGSPAWSPLGDKIAFWSTASGSGIDIWTINADGSNPLQLTAGLTSGDALGIYDVSHITWSPDGRKIAFSAAIPKPPIWPETWAGSLQLFSMNADGTELQQLTNCQSSSPGSPITGFCVNPNWSPDGKQLVYTNDGSYSGVGGIYVMDPGGTNVKRLTVATQTHHWYPSWSTDGERIIFEAMAPASWKMYAMKADGTDWVEISRRAKWQFNGYLNCSRCPRFDQ